MVPVVALPPATLSTIQETLVFVVPVTVATNALKVLPAETVADAGETVTVTGPLAPGLLLRPRPPQPVMKKSTVRNTTESGALNCFTTGYLIPLHANKAARSERVEF